MGNVSKLEILRKLCIEPGDYTVQAMERLNKQRLLRAKYSCLQKTKEILFYNPENDQKYTFNAPSLLRKAPVMVRVVDICPDLSVKVATISHSGYQIQIVRNNIRQGEGFQAPRLLR
ncbi:hypothetical protein TNCV_1287461 [Trichonephila clavipes]|nr:hypothetical protein TNCV_1287461 [Trichonephila clavipes]